MAVARQIFDRNNNDLLYMDQQDIRTLKILEEIDNDHVPSQRDLAGKMNISLGLVNSFIKRLAHKGYFKISNIPANRVKYILTPKGAAEKTRLTYEYIQDSIIFYKSSRQKLSKLFKDLAGHGVKRVVFYGANDLAEIAYISLQEFPIELVAVVDSRKFGETMFGRVVEKPDRLSGLSFDRIIVTAIKATEDKDVGLLDKEMYKDKVVLIW